MNATREQASSQEPYRWLFELNPCPMWICDENTLEMLDVNEAALKLYAWSRKEFLQLTAKDIRPPEDVPRFLREVAGERGSRAASVGEWRHLKRDGTAFDVAVTISSIPYAGRAARLVLVNEITARKRAEAELRRSEQQLKADLDATKKLAELSMLFAREGDLQPVLTAVVDAAIAFAGADFGNIQLLDPDSGNLKIVAQRGFPKWWLKFWDQVSKGQGACGTALGQGRRVIVEDVEQSPIFAGTPGLSRQLKAGVRAVQSTPLVSRSGKALGMFSTHYRTPQRPDERALAWLDLLARQAAELIEYAQAEAQLKRLNATLERRVAERTEELSNANERLRAVMDTALAGIIILNEQGVIESVNPAAMHLFGYRPGEIEGGNAGRLMDWPDLIPCANSLDHCLQAAAPQAADIRGEVQGRCKDGRTLLLELSLAEVTAAGQRQFVAMIRDITARKRLERELLEISEREQQRIGRDLHDGLGQYLHGLAYLAELLEEDLRQDGSPRAAQTGELNRRLQEALHLTRGLAHGLQPVKDVPNGLMFALRELAGHTARLYRMKCAFICRAPVRIRRHDAATHLYRIAQEAVNNALKHGKPARLRLKLAATPLEIVLTVRDNGAGIPPSRGRGEGMGLHIMQYRAKAIGGALAVRKHPRGGTEVVCTVPRKALSLPAQQAHETQAQNTA